MTLKAISPSLNGALFLVAFLLGLPAYANLFDAAPSRGDPFAGIMDRTKLVPANTQRIDSIREKRLAVILSKDTEKHLKWSEEVSHGSGGVNKFFQGMFFGQKTVDKYERLHKDAYAPQAIVNGVVEPLVRKAREVVLVQDLAEFESGGFDLLVLMDVTFVNDVSQMLNKYESGTYINAYFIGRDNSLAGVLEVGETRHLGPVKTYLYDAAALRKEVIGFYEAELDKLLGPDKQAAAGPQEPSTMAPVNTKRPAAERLKELDELLKQGLISKEEAEIKRKKILEEL